MTISKRLFIIATFKEIKSQRKHVIGFGYCSIQQIQSICNFEPTLYNAGNYGWNCDYFSVNEQIGICTGYNYSRGSTVSFHKTATFEQRQKLEDLEQSAYRVDLGDTAEKERIKNDFIKLLEEITNN